MPNVSQMVNTLDPMLQASVAGLVPDPLQASPGQFIQPPPSVVRPPEDQSQAPSPPPLSLTGRLDDDATFRRKILNLCINYRNAARNAVSYYSGDFDSAHDMIMCYSLLAKKDYLALEKGHMRRFILPLTATHINSMTTFITTALFGGDQVHNVEAGNPESEASARVMNSLLKWNDEQQQGGMFQLGWFWVENALTYNRGIMYEEYAPIFKSRWTTDENGKSVKKKERVGSYNKMSIVSPYDFYVDPFVPLFRMQEGRFAGHRVPKTWNELKNRSELDADDPQYVSERAVKELKKGAGKGSLGGNMSAMEAGVLPPYAGQASFMVGRDNDANMSRTAYERSQLAAPITFSGMTDAKDPGLVDFVECWIRLIPKDYEIDDRTEPVIYQITMGNDTEVLSMIESTYEHDQFPYSVAEAHPSPFYQYAPSWAMMLKNIQDYVDYLKNRHQDAIMRTLGNVFIAHSRLVDITDFEDPDKEGKFIMLKPEAEGMPINDVVRQVPMVDITAGFSNEMRGFIQYAESVTSASSGIQGNSASGSTATEFSQSMQMAGNRLTSIARLISVQGVVPQTKRFVSNFQQFLDTEMIRRIEGDDMLDMDENGPVIVRINSDTIQGSFDYRPHDGTLPGADTRKVAALTRSLEAMKMFPEIFQPGPGNLNPRTIFMDLLRVSGMRVAQYRYSEKQLQQAQAAQAAAMQNSQQQQQNALNAEMQMTVAKGAARGAAQGAAKRAEAGAMAPGPAPQGDVPMPGAGTGIVPVGPPQARPQNV